MTIKSALVWLSTLKVAIREGLKSGPGAEYIQVATVQPDGRPSVRTVVFKGFVQENYEAELAESNSDSLLAFTTHIGSSKVEDLKADNHFELVWWFPEIQDQYRISGKAHLITCPEKYVETPFVSQAASNLDWEYQRRHFFDKLPPFLKASFLWPAPGKPLAGPDSFPNVLDPTKLELAMANFVLVVLEPQRVDHVQLRMDGDTRTIYTLATSPNSTGNSWQVQHVNP